jgi:NhaC family Na+:H+ antiporter
MTDSDERRAPSILEAAIPVASLIILVGLSFYLFGDAGAGGPNQVALIVATMVAVLLAWRRGYTLHELGEAAVASVESGLGAVFILFAVGGLIGTWAMSGTLLAMVYYGLQILNPNYFYVTAAAICAVVSFGIGSSWTVGGTIGIGLMGISANMGLDPAITAGAIISGAYFGDTTSPLSDSANLAAGVGGANLYDHIREVLPISAGALAISLVIFWLLGSPGSFDATDKMRAIGGSFHISLILFLPLVVVVVMALLKIPPFTTIFTGALLGGLLAVIVAPERVLAFADPAHGVPTCPGVGIRLDVGTARARPARYARRHEQHADHDLAGHSGLRPRRRRRAERRARAADLAHRCCRAHHRPADRQRRRRRAGRGHRDGGPISRHRPARPHVQAVLNRARHGADRAQPFGRCVGHADFRPHSLEQLRRLSGGDARRGNARLCTLCGLRHRQPAADDRRGLPGLQGPALRAGADGRDRPARGQRCR